MVAPKALPDRLWSLTEPFCPVKPLNDRLSGAVSGVTGQGNLQLFAEVRTLKGG